MLQHVGMLRLRRDAGPALVFDICEGLLDFVDSIPGLVSMQVFRDEGLREDNADIAFAAVFDSEASWRAYPDHPVHRRLAADLILPNVENRSYVQITSPPLHRRTGSDGALAADYREAGLAGHLEPGSRPALVIVDAARAYADPASPLHIDVDRTVEVMVELRHAARRREIPIVITAVRFPPGGGGSTFFAKVPSLACFEEDNPFGELVPELLPVEPDQLLVKQSASAFFGTDLDDQLREFGVDTVVIAGWTTSGCVRATAVDAVQLGYVPIVVSDAVKDRAATPHDASLFDLRSKYAEVWPASEVVEWWDRLQPTRTVR